MTGLKSISHLIQENIGVIVIVGGGCQIASLQGFISSTIYSKVVSSNMSRLEAHAGLFRLLMKKIFDPYVL